MRALVVDRSLEAISGMHGINQNIAIATVLYTSALTDDEITRVMHWLENRWLT